MNHAKLNRLLLLSTVAMLLGGCSNSPDATAIDFVTAADEGRSADATKIMDEALYWNLWNSDPWVPQKGAAAPHWVDHVVVTKSEVKEKNSYGEELAKVTLQIFPKAGAPARTATYYMKKTDGAWHIYGSSS